MSAPAPRQAFTLLGADRHPRRAPHGDRPCGEGLSLADILKRWSVGGGGWRCLWGGQPLLPPETWRVRRVGRGRRLWPTPGAAQYGQRRGWARGQRGAQQDPPCQGLAVPDICRGLTSVMLGEPGLRDLPSERGEGAELPARDRRPPAHAFLHSSLTGTGAGGPCAPGAASVCAPTLHPASSVLASPHLPLPFPPR